MLPRKRELAFRLIKCKKIEDGIASRLPEEYMKFYRELFEKQPKPVHYIPEEGKWKRNPDTGVVTPIQNIPLPTRFPREFNTTLLGGEMIIQGFEKRKPRRRRVPHFWVPHLYRSVVYSEILNQHISAIVTQRLILQVHEHRGFDNYLLENAACDLRTNLALKIKKKILEALLFKQLPYNEEKNNQLYDKYSKYIIPKEDLEWFGLSLHEACMKQKSIEELRRVTVSPLKHKFREEYLEELRNMKISGAETNEESKGWLSRIKVPFTSSKQT